MVSTGETCNTHPLNEETVCQRAAAVTAEISNFVLSHCIAASLLKTWTKVERKIEREKEIFAEGQDNFQQSGHNSSAPFAFISLLHSTAKMTFKEASKLNGTHLAVLPLHKQAGISTVCFCLADTVGVSRIKLRLPRQTDQQIEGKISRRHQIMTQNKQRGERASGLCLFSLILLVQHNAY